MSAVAIQAEGLGKKYHIGRLQKGGHRTLRDSVVDVCAAPLRRVRRMMSGSAGSAADLDEIFWALNDATFEIKQGEVVGLIGRNGAGKSTLLKILSRITEPTRGYADITGRIGSLLEVGTGFHNELTGRENIFLNGIILGMKRAEIQKKFDEIVAFSEIEKFLDTPVKHYSSGMYVRLAFAVAAHLEPEILLVDEVLAVGDARFQKKCLNKMEDVGHGGRTVIFVSHNMSAVTRICQRAILLDGGRVVSNGPASEIVGSYLTGGLGTTAAREWPELDRAPGGKFCRLRGVRVRTRESVVSDTIDVRQPVGIEMEYDLLLPGYHLLPHFYLWNEEGIQILGANDLDPTWRGRRRPAGRYVTTSWIPGNFFAAGTIFVDVAIIGLEPTETQIHEQSVVAFQVIDSMEPDTSRGDWAGPVTGIVRPAFEWTTDYTPAEVEVGKA
jgi:lipopolysaccharide transport system ATP-binding protein